LANSPPSDAILTQAALALSRKPATADHELVARTLGRDAVLRGLAAAFAALSLLAAACGGDDGGDSPSSPTPPKAESPGATATATRPPGSPTVVPSATAAASFEGTLGPATGAPPGATPVTLRDVRVGTSSSFDTIVFQFDGASVSGYSVQYVDRIPSCPIPAVPPTAAIPTVASTRGRATSTPTPSGPTETPVPTPTPFGSVAGKAIIAVKLEPVTTGGGLSRTDFRGGQGALTQATQVCENQNVVAWVVGVAAQKPFRVTTLTNPARLVIDLQQ